jgi:hypothetical protein
MEQLGEVLAFVPRVINRLWAAELCSADRERAERIVRALVERRSEV